MSNFEDLSSLTVTDAMHLLRDGSLSAEKYTESLLDRAEIHRNLNAFITLDRVQALTTARDADRKRAAGAYLGALHGVPLALKDNIDTASLPTSGGTPALKDHRPTKNAPVAQALIDAGATILGKTNMHELAYGITNNNTAFGAVRNPYDPDMIPGGSSGGTGVAVAAHLVPGGLGTDTGGSVRIPAALCGIVGFRPTTGRYSQAGIVPISNTRDTAGPMVRSVADAVLIDGVITGGSATTKAPVQLAGIRLGIARDPFYVNIDSALEKVVEREFDRLRDLGAVLVEFDSPELVELDRAAGFPIALYETVTTLTAYLEQSDIGLSLREVCEATASPDVRDVVMSLFGDSAISEAAYREAMDQNRPALQAAFANCFKSNDVAALVFPTTPLPARPIGQDESVEINGVQVPTFPAYIRNTGPASVAGVPGLSLPVGLTSDGLPVGIELDGLAGSDHDLLAIGLGYEADLEPLPAPQLS